jgi:enoyl-CoA hydratase/carnithine racemase
MSSVAVERHGGVLVVIIDRAHAANAINDAVGAGLCGAFATATADAAIQALVLTGSGARVFCAGADLKNPAGLLPLALAEKRSAILSAMLDAVLSFAKPFVAAVNGVAAGAGAMLALLADAVLAVDTTRFTLPEIEHAMPTPIGLAILKDIGGSAFAADLVLSGRSMAAAEGERRGLMRCVPAAGLLDAALAEAEALGSKPALAFALNKDWLQRGRRQAIAEATRDAGAYRIRSLAAAEA